MATQSRAWSQSWRQPWQCRGPKLWFVLKNQLHNNLFVLSADYDDLLVFELWKFRHESLACERRRICLAGIRHATMNNGVRRNQHTWFPPGDRCLHPYPLRSLSLKMFLFMSMSKIKVTLPGTAMCHFRRCDQHGIVRSVYIMVRLLKCVLLLPLTKVDFRTLASFGTQYFEGQLWCKTRILFHRWLLSPPTSGNGSPLRRGLRWPNAGQGLHTFSRACKPFVTFRFCYDGFLYR